jgi:hypothetical protein
MGAPARAMSSAAEREQVGAPVDAIALRLLGRHVRQRAAQARVGLTRDGERDAEVGQLDLAVGRQQHVARREVAVHEAAPVHVAERPAELDAHVGHERDGQRAPRGALVGDDGGEVGARDVLHGDEVVVADAPEVEHGDEVAVRHRHLRARLFEEHAQQSPIVGQLRQHALDDEALLEPLGAHVAREEDLGHAAAAERPHELVATEARAHDRA